MRHTSDRPIIYVVPAIGINHPPSRICHPVAFHGDPPHLCESTIYKACSTQLSNRSPLITSSEIPLLLTISKCRTDIENHHLYGTKNPTRMLRWHPSLFLLRGLEN